MEYLAQKLKNIDASGIRRIWQMAATMTDPVDFSIGQPDFATPEPVKAAAIKAIREDHNTYTVTAGIEPLRRRLAEIIGDEIGWTNPEILVTAGLSGALQLVLMALLDPGDEVLIPDPYFVSYAHLTNFFGGKCIYVNTYPDFQLSPERLAQSITEKSKVLLLNSPANPTGVVYPTDQLKDIAEIARRHQLLVVSDEIYADFSYDAPADTIGHYYENTLILRGFSKAYAVPGWRLGYIAAPPHLTEMIDQMGTLQQYTFVCAPHPFQIAALTALDCDIRPHIDNYRRKRDLIYEGLKNHFDLARPMGAFYAFAAAPGRHATEFVAEAIKNNVLIIPGAIFSQRDTHFRVSYATDDASIRKGVDRLCRLAEQG